jgi:uncharacterized membrane protein
MFTTSHLHPMLVHYPIALLIFGFIAVFVAMAFGKGNYLPKTGYFLLLAGTLMALVVLFSGIFFTTDLTGPGAEIQDKHETFAWITLFLSSATSILWSFLKYKDQEDTSMKWVVFVLYGLSAISVSVTGLLGGTLVYNYMMTI